MLGLGSLILKACQLLKMELIMWITFTDKYHFEQQETGHMTHDMLNVNTYAIPLEAANPIAHMVALRQSRTFSSFSIRITPIV